MSFGLWASQNFRRSSWHLYAGARSVLEGEIIASVGDRTIKATPGTMVFLPRDIVHSFVIESEHLRMLVLVAPAGLEKWFKEFSVPAPDLTLPPAVEAPFSEIQKMLAAAPKYGLELLLPRA